MDFDIRSTFIKIEIIATKLEIRKDSQENLGAMSDVSNFYFSM